MKHTNDNSGAVSLQEGNSVGRRVAPSAVPTVVRELDKVVLKLGFLRNKGEYFTTDEKRYIREAGCAIQDLMFNLGEE